MVKADLSNFNPYRGSITLNLTADRALLAQRTVTVGIDAQRTVHLRTRFDAPGRYEMRLEGEPVGTVTVVRPTETATESPRATRTPTSVPTRTSTPTSVPTRTPTPTPTPSGSGASTTGTPADPTPADVTDGAASVETTSGSGPGFGPVALFGAVAALAGWSAVRRERGD